MNNAPFVTIYRDGLIKGAKVLIDGKVFASSDSKLFEQHWNDACEHARAIIFEQDGPEPRNRSLQDRQNLYRVSQ